MSYDKQAAQNLLRREPNLLRWHDRANTVRTHDHCQLGSEHIEAVIARALEQAYQDGLRDGALSERKSALQSIIANSEGIEASMRSRVVETRKELAELEQAKPTFPVRR